MAAAEGLTSIDSLLGEMEGLEEFEGDPRGAKRNSLDVMLGDVTASDNDSASQKDQTPAEVTGAPMRRTKTFQIPDGVLPDASPLDAVLEEVSAGMQVASTSRADVEVTSVSADTCLNQAAGSDRMSCSDLDAVLDEVAAEMDVSAGFGSEESRQYVKRDLNAMRQELGGRPQAAPTEEPTESVGTSDYNWFPERRRNSTCDQIEELNEDDSDDDYHAFHQSFKTPEEVSDVSSDDQPCQKVPLHSEYRQPARAVNAAGGVTGPTARRRRRSAPPPDAVEAMVQEELDNQAAIMEIHKNRAGAIEDMIPKSEEDQSKSPQPEDDLWAPPVILKTASEIEEQKHTEIEEESCFERIVRSRWFEWTVMGAIAGTCLQLALDKPCDSDDSDSIQGQVDGYLDYFFLAIFTCEFVLKHLAHGLKRYWSSGWNRLDALVVLTGFVSLIPSMDKIVLVRLLRVLRPLRIINKLDGMKKITHTLAAAAVPLADTGVLCGLMFFMFGIVGLTLFAGCTRRHCYNVTTVNGTVSYELDESLEYSYGVAMCGGEHKCSDTQICSFSDSAPNFSLTGFDNMPMAFLSIFVAVTLEGWADNMYMLQDSSGYWPATVYFHLLVILGALFIVNLALAVLADSFDLVLDESEAELDPNNDFGSLLAPDGESDTEEEENDDPNRKFDAFGREIGREVGHRDHKGGDCTLTGEPRVDVQAEEEQRLLKADQDAGLSRLGIVRRQRSRAISVMLSQEQLDAQKHKEALQAALSNEEPSVLHKCRECCFDLANAQAFGDIILVFILLNMASLALEHKRTVEVNGVWQAADMDPDLATGLDYANYGFVGVFALEAVVKLIGLGVREYFSDTFNSFDFVVVLSSFVEIALAGQGSFSALRCGRLMRVFKLTKRWTSMRVIMTTVLETLPQMGYLCLMLFLFMFLAAVAGMQIFGCKLRPPILDETPRGNFDNFGVAMLTVFQIIGGENWNDVMYSSVETTNYAAAIYFVVLVVIGTFIMLNLTLAILLSNFGAGACPEIDFDEIVDAVKDFGLCLCPCLKKKAVATVAPEDSYKTAESPPQHTAEGANWGVSDGSAPVSPDKPTQKRCRTCTELNDIEKYECHNCGSKFRRASNEKKKSLQTGLESAQASKDGGTNATNKMLSKAGMLPVDNGSITDLDSSMLGQRNNKLRPLTAAQAAQASKRNRGGLEPIAESGGLSQTGSGSGSSSGLDDTTKTRDGDTDDLPDLTEQRSVPELVRVGSMVKPSAVLSCIKIQNAIIMRGYILNLFTAWKTSTAPDGFEQAGLGQTMGEAMQKQAQADQKTKEELDDQRDCTGFVVPSAIELTGVSLWLFAPENKVRIGLSKVVEHPLFENVILLCIFISSMLLAFEEPGMDEESTKAKNLQILDYLFTAIFTVEMIAKVIVYCFFFDKNAYLRSGFNVLDFSIVLVSLLSVSKVFSSGGFRALRTFRALRPLRTIKRAPGLRSVVDAIFRCMPGFINIALVSSVVYLVFAILGVQFWGGKFWKCTDPSVVGVSQCIGTASDGTIRKWQNAPINFDNVSNGMLTLFECASMELWLDVMHHSMDAPADIGEQPEANRQWWAACFYVVFTIVGPFLIMNLFVGAVVDTFARVKSENGRAATLTEEQLQFVVSIKEMANSKPTAVMTEPEDQPGCIFRIRSACFKLVVDDRFDAAVILLIVVNICVMSMQIWEKPAMGVPAGSQQERDLQETTWNDSLEWCNTFFTLLFAVEATLKLIGLGWRQYFGSMFNVFDFTVLITSIAGFILDLIALDSGNSDILQVVLMFRAARVMRVFRLTVKFGGVRRLLETLLFALPSLLNVTMLLCLVLFIFTIMGMNLFGTNQLSTYSGYDHYGLHTEHANFREFWKGFFTLFRMSTGESWNGIMHDIMEESGGIASLFFVSYMVIGSSLLFNLVVAILLDEFSSRGQADGFKVTPGDLKHFSDMWIKFDPEATQSIKLAQVPLLLLALGEPLGVPEGTSLTGARVAAMKLYIPITNGQANFVEVVSACMRSVLRVTTLDEEVMIDAMHHLYKSFPNMLTEKEEE